jgi:hypothetical protein
MASAKPATARTRVGKRELGGATAELEAADAGAASSVAAPSASSVTPSPAATAT